jgi:hypothetical protein
MMMLASALGVSVDGLIGQAALQTKARSMASRHR